jgi:hypothetical protein
MKVPGYTTKGKPDQGWWLNQIWASREQRKKQALMDKWEMWDAYYKGDWKEGILPKNIFFSTLRMTVPRVYFRNPSVSVSPAMPGMMNMVFAQVVGRIDNKMLNQINIKRELKKMVQQTFKYGTSAGKAGFGAEFVPIPPQPLGEPPRGKQGERYEYHPDVFPNMPWFQGVHPGHLLVAPGCTEFSTSRWVGIEVTRPYDDVVADTRLDRKAREGVKRTKRDSWGAPETLSEVDLVELVEIRDRQTGRVLVLAPYTEHEGHFLHDGEDELQEDGCFPIYDLIFNHEDSQFWGTADSKILEPYQLELNEGRTQMMKHRRLAIIKLMMRKGVIDEGEITKMLSEDVAAVIQTNEDPKDLVDKFQVANIPTDLILSERETMEDVRETAGFSRNYLGEFQPGSEKPTATEARAVHQSSEVRIDERQDMVADVLLRFTKSMNQMLFRRWGGEQVVDVVGPGGAQVWVKFNPSQLRMGRYTIKVDPDSSSPKTREIREARAFAIYAQFKENPLIDPVKLTQFVLTELEGVQMDDLMAQIPPNESGAGATPGQALGMGQYANLVNRQMQQVPAKAGGRR